MSSLGLGCVTEEPWAQEAQILYNRALSGAALCSKEGQALLFKALCYETIIDMIVWGEGLLGPCSADVQKHETLELWLRRSPSPSSHTHFNLRHHLYLHKAIAWLALSGRGELPYEKWNLITDPELHPVLLFETLNVGENTTSHGRGSLLSLMWNKRLRIFNRRFSF